EKERTLSIEELSGSGLFGVQAEGVTLQDRASGATAESAPDEPADSAAGEAEGAVGKDAGETKAKAKAKPKPKQRRESLHFDSIDIGFSLLSYIIGNLKVSFDAEVGGGTIEGSFFQNELVAKLSVEGQDVDISELTLLGKAVGLPLGGALSGHVELELPERSMSKAAGAFELTIADLTVGDGKAKVRNTSALPRLNAGTLKRKAKATDGKLDLETFGADGPDFEMKSEGKVRLRQPFDKSLADI